VTVPGSSVPAQLEQLHQTYCHLTGQNISLRFDRERLWFEFLRVGFTLADLCRVVRYLQKEIRHTRRKVGALKLSNLLQLDCFEEDLNISRVRLSPEPPKAPVPLAPTCSPAEQERGRQRALLQLQDLQKKLCQRKIWCHPQLHAPRGSTRSQIISITSACFSRIITIILSQNIVKRNMTFGDTI
jgi:hypothetical protein